LWLVKYRSGGINPPVAAPFALAILVDKQRSAEASSAVAWNGMVFKMTI